VSLSVCLFFSTQGTEYDPTLLDDRKPTAIFACFYEQVQRRVRPDANLPSNIHLCSDPCSDVGYGIAVREAQQILQEIDTNAKFFPVEEVKTKPTYFEDDPDGLASLSSDSEQEDDDDVAEATETTTPTQNNSDTTTSVDDECGTVPETTDVSTTSTTAIDPDEQP
jgi:hypothetical protein